jgi:predicted Zn-dependent protease
MDEAAAADQPVGRVVAVGDAVDRREVAVAVVGASTPERITQVTQAARRIGAPGLGADDRNRYLAASVVEPEPVRRLEGDAEAGMDEAAAADQPVGRVVAVDGIAYGDNPADGLIRGRRFIHPRLGVAFEAPDGFGLDNTARAVLGMPSIAAR